MAPDDESNISDAERQHLLEEIRLRAEAAELKRLEEAEKEEDSSAARTEVPSRPAGPTPFPTPSFSVPSVPTKPPGEQRLNVLRERLTIALDRGKADKASEILGELGRIDPENPELEVFRSRLSALQTETTRAKEPEPAPERRPEPPPPSRVGREEQRRKIEERLEAANTCYQNEHYEKGLEGVEQVLAMDPGNEAAERLKVQILKAQNLAEQLRREEARRKAEDREAPAAPKRVEEAGPREENEVWGTSLQQNEVSYELPPEEKGPVGPPKTPLLDRVVERASKIRIPLKPVLTVAGGIIALLVGYKVLDNVLNSVSPPRYSIIVLPVVNLPGDTSLGNIADGMTSEFIKDLGQISEMRVVAAPTAFNMQRSSLGPQQIARTVGTNYYLQCSVGRVQDGFVFQPSLCDTSSTTPIWASKYQVSDRELPSIQFDITRAVAGAMQASLSDEEKADLSRMGTSSPEAYRLYLTGRSMQRQGQYTIDAILDVFLRAVQADSGFGDALAALGWVHVLAYEGGADQPQVHLAEASRCVQRAVSLGSRSSETFRVWGMLEQSRLDYNRAMDRLEQAVALSPSDAEAQRRLALVYVIRRRTEAALNAAERAASDDPGNLASLVLLGNIQQFMGEYKQALETYERGLRVAPDRSEFASGHYADVLVYLQQPDRALTLLEDRVARARDSYVDYYRLGRASQSAGRPIQEWQSAFRKAEEILSAGLRENPDDPGALSFLALVRTRLGEFKEAIASSNRALALAPTDVDVLYNSARMYALHRNNAQALDYLSKAVNKQFILSNILDMDFFNLRSEPDFIKAISR